MKLSPENRTRSASARMLIGAFLFLAGTGLWCLPKVRAKFAGPSSRTVVTGNLTQRDLVEIRRGVWHQMRLGVTWRHFLPDLSWSSWKQLPTRIRSAASRRIVAIGVEADGTVKVQTSVKEPNGFVRGCQWKEWQDLSFRLKKGKAGWQIFEFSLSLHGCG